MNILHKLALLILAGGLAACQQTMPRQAPEPVDPAPPVMQGSASSAKAPAVAATASRNQSNTVITLHLAQEKAEAPLVAVDVGGTSLYALPLSFQRHSFFIDGRGLADTAQFNDSA